MPKRKTVLLFTVELFDGRNSGAQRVYELLIENNPDIEFEYFVRQSNLTRVDPPPNVNLIGISDTTLLDFDSLVPFVANRKFVYIDIPDWHWANTGIRNNLKKHNIQFKKILVAAHGDAAQIRKYAYYGTPNLSEARHVANRQKDLYKTADYLYGLNPFDSAWADINKRFIAINPVDFIEVSFWSKAMNLNMDTDDERLNPNVQRLVFFGRQDGHKGIHLILDSMAEDETEGLTLDLVGPESYDPKESSLVRIRKNILKDRITFDLPLGREELFDKLMAPGGLIVIPSPYESFCIAALEMFFLNTRVVIDSKIPALSFIHQTMPTPNFYEFNTSDTASDLSAVIKNAKISRTNTQVDIKKKKQSLEKNSKYVRIYEFSENLTW